LREYFLCGEFNENTRSKQTIVYQKINTKKSKVNEKKETHLSISIEKVGLALNNSLT